MYWIAVAGTDDDPLPNEWRVRGARWERRQGPAMFSLKARIRAGDQLVMYATGSPGQFGAGRFFAVCEVCPDPEPSTHERWNCKVRVRDVVAGPYLAHCPRLTRSAWRPNRYGAIPTSR